MQSQFEQGNKSGVIVTLMTHDLTVDPSELPREHPNGILGKTFEIYHSNKLIKPIIAQVSSLVFPMSILSMSNVRRQHLIRFNTCQNKFK